MRTVDVGELERDYDELMLAVAHGERIAVIGAESDDAESDDAVVLMPQRDYDAMTMVCRDHYAK